MIQNPAVERFGGRREPSRGIAISLARPFIAARVVMGEDKANAPMGSHVSDDRAQREIRSAFIARMTSDPQAAHVLVEMQNPQVFAPAVRSGDAGGYEASDCTQDIDLLREFGTLTKHAAY